MKRKVLAAMVIAASLLVGCGTEGEAPATNPQVVTPVQMGEGSTAPEATGEGSTAPEATPETQEPVGADGKMSNGENHPITSRAVVEGKMQSYLTGEWKDASVVQRMNMAVMMPNNKAALPHYGISHASMYYEAPVEGAITRLMCFFEDYDDLDRIGPVRSSRDYYVYEAMAYDSIYCNWGLAIPYVGPVINTDRIDNVSQALKGIDVAAPEAFDRVSRPGYKDEYRGYMFTEGYTKAVERLGYAKEYTDRFVQAFTFADDGYTATYDSYPSATKVYPGGTKSNAGGYGEAKPCFEYNPEDGLYYRTQYGSELKDEQNGEQVAVSNVVFKICHGEARDANGYLAFRVHGTGDAYVFTNGKVIKGTWSRENDYDPNLFLDENGKEIVFNQGKTWICCIWEEKNFISYE